MKKLILTGATLLAFAAVSFAQSNNATLNQNGNSQTSEQSQTGNRNASTIEQLKGGSTNTGNFAKTVQTGSSTGSPMVVNSATVQQSNGANGNRAGITQNATGSLAFPGGLLDGNSATIRQRNNSGSNTSTPVNATNEGQGDVTSAGGNWANINQQGRQLNGTVEQDGTGTNASTGNAASMIQNDRSHVGTIRQSAGGNGNSEDNTATMSQYGAGNTAEINQRDRSSGNTATTTQYSRNSTDVLILPNQARVDQDGTISSSTNNKATIRQGTSGARYDANEAYSSQRGDGNDVQITQVNGDGNQAGRASNGTSPVIQVGEQNLTTIDQSGNANRANIVEAYGNYNTIDIDQISTGTLLGNTAEVRMQSPSSPNNNNNFVGIDQDGANNTAIFNLRASNTTKPGTATLKIEQDGRNNYAEMSVSNQNNNSAGASGMDNTVDVQQTSGSGVLAAGHIVKAGIQGSKNDVTIDQTGTNNRVGTESNKGLRIIGDDNTVILSQSNSNNQMNLRLEGGTENNGNSVQITQTGNNNRVGTGGITDAANNNVTDVSALGVFISGDRNEMVIEQNGGDEVKATQNGDDELTVRQTGGNSSTAQTNRVLINQGGTGKQIAEIDQFRQGNFVYGLDGVNSFATQTGAGTNRLDVDQRVQTGSGVNNAFVGQNGAGNNINITQVKP